MTQKKYFLSGLSQLSNQQKKIHFYYHIPSGKYAILHDVWTQSKWYGGKTYTEPIFRRFAFSNIESKIKSGQIKEEELEQYKFSIQSNSLNYLGTWHFDKEIVSFSENKINLDKKLSETFTRLDFKNAIITILN